MYEERLYRSHFKAANLVFFDVCILETDLRIGAVKNLYKQAFDSVKKHRAQIEAYIRLFPEFLTSLKPLEAVLPAAPIITGMCRAAKSAGVGPMAAVAGAVSELVGLDLLAFSDEVIVENGGDIFIKSGEARRIGIYAGNSPLNEKIAMEISPEKTPLGICTSSGTVGHSLSFGCSDAVVVVSKDTFLADAVATATGNLVKTPDDIEKAVNFASKIKGVEGVVIIIGDKMGAWGDIKLIPY